MILDMASNYIIRDRICSIKRQLNNNNIMREKEFYVKTINLFICVLSNVNKIFICRFELFNIILILNFAFIKTLYESNQLLLYIYTSNIYSPHCEVVLDTVKFNHSDDAANGLMAYIIQLISCIKFRPQITTL